MSIKRNADGLTYTEWLEEVEHYANGANFETADLFDMWSQDYDAEDAASEAVSDAYGNDDHVDRMHERRQMGFED